MKRSAIAAVLAFGLVAIGTPAAHADEPTPKSLCAGGRVVYKASKAGSGFVRASGKNAATTGGPGVTLTISTTDTYTVGGSLTTTTGISAGSVVASVKADIGVTLQSSRSGTTSSTGSWKVPSSYKQGRLEIGSFKYSGSVSKYIENRSCQLVRQATTNFNAPRNEWHFQTSKIA